MVQSSMAVVTQHWGCEVLQELLTKIMKVLAAMISGAETEAVKEAVLLGLSLCAKLGAAAQQTEDSLAEWWGRLGEFFFRGKPSYNAEENKGQRL